MESFTLAEFILLLTRIIKSLSVVLFPVSLPAQRHQSRMAKTKEKKEKKVATEDVEMGDEVDSYDVKSQSVCAIASPLAPKKLNKKILKTIKKASKAKHVKRGVKEVVKALRKKEHGLVIIAGDISPIDVISHLPVLCEDNNIPYIYTPSKEELGGAGGTKRPTSVVMVQLGGKKKDESASADYKEAYEEIVKEIEKGQK